MPNVDGIRDVLNRIMNIQAKFTPNNINQTLTSGIMPFDATLRKVMSAQSSMPSTMLNASGPGSMQNLLGAMGLSTQIDATAQMGLGGVSALAGNKLVEVAKEWAGKEFKPGQTARCADFVSTMIKRSGAAPSNFKHEVNCWELQKVGKKVAKSDLKPGDIVYFGYTYLPVDYTHVGIYLGDGKFVHRPTANKPVRIDSLNSGYYGTKYCGARRISEGG